MRSEVVHITPELAAEWLGNNYEKNRKIRTSYVDQLAEVMKSGRFVSENGQTIVFGNDGVLYDGQHRLSAVVQSGCPQDMLVVWVDDGKKAYTTIDNGTKRQASDFLDELKNRPSCAAHGKIMACVEWGNMPLLSCLNGMWSARTRVDRGLVISYCTSHAASTQEEVRVGRLMRSEVGCGAASAYSAFIGVVRYCGKDELLDEFVDDFLSIAPDSKTVVALKQLIMRANSRGVKLDVKWLFGTLLDGYTHYCEMDDSVTLNKRSSRIKQYSSYISAKRAEEVK